MEGLGGDGPPQLPPIAKWRNDFSRAFQYYLDRSTPHPVHRWLGTAAAAAIYILRVYYIQGFYIISYGLGIYILNLLIGFLSPKVDPELEVSEGASLPTKGSDEFKPFIRRLPEFKFWYAITKAFFVAFLLTFFSVLDVPVFWPILLIYWFVLFVLTMKRQIMHMIKYKYVPFNLGKQMSGRIYVVILFFWAILTIVTPILVRLSANAKQNLHYNGEIREGLKSSGGAMGLLSRRALISIPPIQAAAPSPAPGPGPGPGPGPAGYRYRKVRQPLG